MADLTYLAAIRPMSDVPSVYDARWHMGAVTVDDEYGLELNLAAAVAAT